MGTGNIALYYLKKNTQYNHWKPIFTVMLGTGTRVGEITGLRWCDIDLDEDIIDVNHTLVYYNHETNGSYFSVHMPKTEAGKRRIPILESGINTKWYRMYWDIKMYPLH